MVNGTADVQEARRRLALRLGLRSDRDRSRPPDRSGAVDLSLQHRDSQRQAGADCRIRLTRGTDQRSIARIERAVAGWLRELKMRGDGRYRLRRRSGSIAAKCSPVTATGIFTATVERGHSVVAGTVIGRITDFHGAVVQEVKAPFAGIVLYVLGTPPISKGEPVAFVGQVQK